MATVLLAVLIGATAVVAFHYEAPSDCHWYLINGTWNNSNAANGQEVALYCRLRTINSQFDQTNFSVIPREHTAQLHIECSDSLLYQSFLLVNGLSHLHHVRDLTIEFCKVAKVSRGVLHGLRSLRHLAIRSHNDVWPAMNLELSRDSLVHDAAQLESLDLSWNNMWTLPARIFCDLSALQTLNVSHNRMPDLLDLSLDGDETLCPTPLHVLDVSYNQLTVLPSGGLKSARHLRALHLNRNAIRLVDADSLHPLDQLETLDLSANQITSLPAALFQTTPSLRQLDLSNNSLADLGGRLLAPLRHLEVLILSNNQLALEQTESSVFGQLVRLVVLDLARNRIVRLWRHLLADLYSLQSLNLEDNQIESIEASAFTALSNLHTLKLSANRLTSVGSSYFNGLLVLSRLKLDDNRIASVQADSFQNCSNLQELDVRGNRLEHVPTALRALTLLKTLDVSHNRIASLNSTVLRGLHNLMHLRLSGNPLKVIRAGTFPPLNLLKSLDLSACGLESVERAALDPLTSLETLYLNSNNLTSLENVVHNLPNLVKVNASDNDLRWFDYALIPTSVEWLDLHRNKIEELGNYLRLEAHLRLQTLDASDNRITFLGAQSLPDRVRMASFSENAISVIEPNTFADKANLSRVDLYGNQLVTLNLNALRLSPQMDRRHLPEFYLGGNPFQCDCDMEWLQRINALNNAGQYPRAMDLDSIYCRLSYGRGRAVTPLVEASSSDFLCPYRTHCFALCHCCEFDACDCEMTCPANCSCYHDQSWSTNVVDCSANGISDIPSRIPMDATDVYLDGNNLPQLSQHAFIGKKNLKTLLLNNSQVEQVHNNTFSGLKRLQILHLDANRLTALHGHEFEPLENLRELYLQRNQIHFIQSKVFSHLKNLQVLDMSHNQLAHYAVAELSANAYLSHLSLADNPWTCQCPFTAELMTWMASNRDKIVDAAVTCSNGRHLLTGDATIVQSADIPCSSVSSDLLQHVDWLTLVAATCATALLIGCLVVALCCCWRPLRAVCYDRCGWCHDDPPDDGRPFDVLVVYSAKDDSLMKDRLLSRLQPPATNAIYRLCLQHRDNYDLNAAAMASRRLLVVLTKNFMETEWGKMEVRSLLRSSWNRRQAAPSVIVLVPDKKWTRQVDSDLDLHLLFNNCTMIDCSSRLFGQELRLALPRPRPASDPPLPAHPQPLDDGQPLHQLTDPVVRHSKLVHQRQLPTVPETI